MYDNIKSHKETGLCLFSEYHIFGKTTEGDQIRVRNCNIINFLQVERFGALLKTNAC